jgi:hypothetical protein
MKFLFVNDLLGAAIGDGTRYRRQKSRKAELATPVKRGAWPGSRVRPHGRARERRRRAPLDSKPTRPARQREAPRSISRTGSAASLEI